MGRRWIGIELGEHAYTHCVPRLRKVVQGQDPGGITKAVGWAGGGGFKTCRLAESLLERDEEGMLRFNPDFTDEMVAEAVAKIEGYRYNPAPPAFWKQGQSSEKDFLYVTKVFVTRQWLEQLAAELSADESLLICCPAYGEGCERAFANINLKKIPQAFMSRFEWDKDDYSLNVSNVMANMEEEPDDVGTSDDEPSIKSKKTSKKSTAQGSLF
jgi:adenine-specific DNA-methyltransferase